MSKHKITKISDIEQSQLSEFYKEIYFERHKSLTNDWHWWYRVGYSNYEPLICTVDKKVVGQAGTLPVDLNINGKNILGVWFLDFAVLKGFQKQGIGKNLIIKLMETCPNIITLCNDKTLKLIKNSGWENNLSVSRLARPINPTNFIPIVSKLKLKFLDNLYKKILKKKLKSPVLLSPKKVVNNYEVIKESFLKRNLENKKEDYPYIIRNEEWLNWRIMQCPYKKDLYFFEYKNNFSIVHIFSIKNIKRMNIIFNYFVDKSEETIFFDLIINWAINNNIDLVWAIKEVKSNNGKNIFPNEFKKPLNYACWSSNENTFEVLKNAPYNIECIDSDIDSNMFKE